MLKVGDISADALIDMAAEYAEQQHGAVSFTADAFAWSVECALFMAVERGKTVQQFIEEVSGNIV